MTAQQTYFHWVRLSEADLDLILTFEPEDEYLAAARLPQKVIATYRKWAATVREAVENGLDEDPWD